MKQTMKTENNGWYIVTGATGSIGNAIVRKLVEQHQKVIMACRNTHKAEEIYKQLTGGKPRPHELRIMQLDLSSFYTIHKFTEEIIREEISVHALIHNAGVMDKKFKITEDGYEQAVQINYLAPLLLTRLLLPALHPGSHIIFTTSLTRHIGIIDRTLFSTTKEEFNQFRAYSRAKLALTSYARHLAHELEEWEISVNLSDPGVVDTDMITLHRWFDPLVDLLLRPFIHSPEKGARPVLRILETTDPHQAHIWSGARTCKPVPPELLNPATEQWLIETTDKIIELVTPLE